MIQPQYKPFDFFNNILYHNLSNYNLFTGNQNCEFNAGKIHIIKCIEKMQCIIKKMLTLVIKIDL